MSEIKFIFFVNISEYSQKIKTEEDRLGFPIVATGVNGEQRPDKQQTISLTRPRLHETGDMVIALIKTQYVDIRNFTVKTKEQLKTEGFEFDDKTIIDDSNPESPENKAPNGGEVQI